MDETNEKEAPKLQFGDLDQLMMMLIYGGTNLIDKSWTVHRQAERIAEFNAHFMNMRAEHEEQHVTKQSAKCPFCSALKLNANLNREHA